MSNMILSDISIRRLINLGKIKLIPGNNETFEEIVDNIACSSFDLRLGNEFKIFPKGSDKPLDPMEKEQPFELEKRIIKDGEPIILQPGEFMLGATKEQIGLPDDIVARVEGRSSIARLGVLVHITGGFIDPGFGWDNPSTITLEIKNVNTVPVILRPNMRVCQIAFETMDSPAEIPYNKKKTAKYNGQIDPEKSRLYLNG